MNEVSEELCLNNPLLLNDRQRLLNEARKRLHELGYNYKKGQSRSKTLNPDFPSEGSTPKRKKITEEFRLSRIDELQDKVKDLNDQIAYKEKRREAASNIHNYKDCDVLTEQMSALKTEKRQLEYELATLTKKQNKSKWYKERKRTSVSSSPSSDTSTIAQSPSSLFKPVPIRSHARNFTSPLSPRSSCTPSPASPSPVGSKSISPDASHCLSNSDADTLILSSDEEPESHSALKQPASNLIRPSDVEDSSVSGTQYFQ